MAKKNDREYYVLVGDGSGQNYALASCALADRPACEKWIRKNGEPGAAYHVVVFVGKAIYVQVERIEKRTLLPESEAPAAEE